VPQPVASVGSEVRANAVTQLRPAVLLAGALAIAVVAVLAFGVLGGRQTPVASQSPGATGSPSQAGLGATPSAVAQTPAQSPAGYCQLAAASHKLYGSQCMYALLPSELAGYTLESPGYEDGTYLLSQKNDADQVRMAGVLQGDLEKVGVSPKDFEYAYVNSNAQFGFAVFHVGWIDPKDQLTVVRDFLDAAEAGLTWSEKTVGGRQVVVVPFSNGTFYVFDSGGFVRVFSAGTEQSGLAAQMIEAFPNQAP
jgi:hypothetical protein